MKGKHKIWIGVGLLMIFVTLPASGQVPPDGEIDYGGTTDGDQEGTITGTITPDASGDDPVEQVIQEYTVKTRTRQNGFSESVDPTRFSTLFDINKTASRTYIEGWIYASVNSQTTSTSFRVTWDIDGNDIDSVTNCDIGPTGLHINVPAGATAGAAGVGESRFVCEFDNYQDSIFTVTSTTVEFNDVEGAKVGFSVWNMDIYNRTIPQPTHPSSSFSGTFTGTYDGEERGLISPHGGGGGNNTTQVQNLSAENFTFENIMGSLSVEELDFWLPIVFFTIVAWVAFNRDATMIGLSAILGILFVLTGMGAWSIAASLVLMSLGFTLEYLAKRVWRRKRKNME